MSIRIIEHPLLQDKLARMRDKETLPIIFRALVAEVAMLLAYEATRDLATAEANVVTPTGETALCHVLKGKGACIVPILRAGLGMVEGIEQLMPNAVVGHLGIFRDHDTLRPVVYYQKLPVDINERDVIIVDPMFATGGSLIAACDMLKKLKPHSLRAMCILAAPEGMKSFEEAHPDVNVYCAAVDRCLNDKGYILPGLGDAGDRLFGTK